VHQHAGGRDQAFVVAVADQPADAEQAKRKKPDRAGDRFAIVEAVRAGKADFPAEWD